VNIVDAIGYGDDRHAAAFERDRPLRYTHTYTHQCVHHTFSICITHADIAATTPHTHTRERGVWKKRSIRARQTRPLALHTDLAVPALVHVALNLTQCPLSFCRGYSISVSLSPFPSLSLSLSISLNLSQSLARSRGCCCGGRFRNWTHNRRRLVCSSESRPAYRYRHSRCVM
jgi:hypothetical protein